MKKMIVLRPTKTGRKIWFNGTIVNASGGQTVVTSDYLIKRKEEMSANERPLSAKFDATYTALIIEWDSIYEDGPKRNEFDTLVGEMDHRKYRASRELCRHHQVKPLYGIANPNLKGVPMFELEDLAVRNQYGTSRIINQWKVVTKALKMSYQQLTDCAYYYGYSGASKNRSDLWIYLTDFKLGVLHDDVQRESNQLSTMTDFLEKYQPTSKSVEMKVVVEKALIRGLVRKLDNGYYYNDYYIGSKKEHIIDYLSGNEPIYDHIKSQVAHNTLGEDDIANIIEKAINTDEKSAPDAQLLIKEQKSDELLTRDLAKAKHIKAWAVTKPDNLRAQFDEADELIKKCTERNIAIGNTKEKAGPDNEILYLEDMRQALAKYERDNKIPAPKGIPEGSLL